MKTENLNCNDLEINSNDLESKIENILKDYKICKFDGCHESFCDGEDQLFYDHVATHISNRNWKCRWVDCTYSTSNKGSKIRHLRIHTGEKKFKCQRCQASFVDQSTLRRHIEIHNKEVEMHNEEDDKTESESEEDDKTESESEENLELLVCTWKKCFKEFKSFECFCDHVNKHAKSLIGNKNKKCLFDGCIFENSKQSNFNDHIRTHSGEKQFECKKCPKKFVKKSALDQHVQRMHWINKKFQCMFEEYECSHGTNDRYKLGQHIISQHLKKIKKQNGIVSWRQYQAETIKELAQKIMDTFYPSKRGANQYSKKK